MEDFEKLGVFYLGRNYDLKTKKPSDHLILYQSKDLVTHAVCVGMTGSGKTGLCLSLLEEAAIDDIPALVIDPKGDLSNLLLTFPKLRGEDFAPWVNEDDAKKKGLSIEDYGKQQADLWKKGLAEWGQDGDRIQRLRDSADFAIYTPGSNAGLPISILKSFAAPEQAVRDDSETLRDRIGTTATSLLGLMGINADPVQSREHILLSTILNDAWKDGQDLDLAALIRQIQTPPFSQVGVVDLESFYPAKERFKLAMQLNNLLASPGFSAWMEGEPLDIGALLHTPQGKPRISIFSIAHLSDSERMFFVSLLLSQTLGWVRAQSGTTSLRALLYMDEIFGYFPPVANPPSKAPLLTLLKQARAFGFGVVLATQNPVDLDYKGLANTGTWFIGRLQTERDKARVMEGLEGAATAAGATFNRGQMEQTLAALGSRIFLLQNVHEDAPVVFQVRWALSYLRGPLTRDQIKKLMASRSGETAGPAPSPAGAQAAAASAATAGGQRPLLPPEVPQFFAPLRGAQPSDSQLLYRPMLLGCGRVYFTDPKSGVDVEQPLAFLAGISADAVALNWPDAKAVELDDSDLEKDPAEGAVYSALPPPAAKAKSYDAWKKSFVDFLFRGQKLEVFKSPSLGLYSKSSESERDFRARLHQAAREERDARAEELRQKYAPKLAALEERIRRANQAVEREEGQAQQSKFQTVLSFGATLLSAFLGRKTLSATTIGKATTAARGVGRSMKKSQDVSRAQENVEALQQQHDDLDRQFKDETAALEAKIDPETEKLETIAVKPKKSNINVRLIALAWMPHWRTPNGDTTAAWE
jgi:hypothetical protein